MAESVACSLPSQLIEGIRLGFFHSDMGHRRNLVRVDYSMEHREFRTLSGTLPGGSVHISVRIGFAAHLPVLDKAPTTLE